MAWIVREASALLKGLTAVAVANISIVGTCLLSASLVLYLVGFVIQVVAWGVQLAAYAAYGSWYGASMAECLTLVSSLASLPTKGSLFPVISRTANELLALSIHIPVLANLPPLVTLWGLSGIFIIPWFILIRLSPKTLISK